MSYLKMSPHFQQEEFQGYWTKLNPTLIQALFQLREEWGAPIHISKAPGAVGRETGSGYHNWVKHGSVMAIDTLVLCRNLMDIGRFTDAADRCGFHGIGIYPEWEPRNLGTGFHLDIGGLKGRRWSGKLVQGEHVYTAFEDALDRWSAPT